MTEEPQTEAQAEAELDENAGGGEFIDEVQDGNLDEEEEG